MNHRIILASKSPRRKYILKTMGYNPVIRVSNTDESKIKEEDPKKLVRILSRLKAEDIALSCRKGDIIIAADTVVSLDNKILGKPHSKKEADAMLHTISGKKHIVYTGVTIILKEEKGQKDKIRTFYDKAAVTVQELSQSEIDEYIATGEPMDKAGAYGIQGIFGRHISGINGDYYTVMGLPAHKVYKEINRITGGI